MNETFWDYALAVVVGVAFATLLAWGLV